MDGHEDNGHHQGHDDGGDLHDNAPPSPPAPLDGSPDLSSSSFSCHICSHLKSLSFETALKIN